MLPQLLLLLTVVSLPITAQAKRDKNSNTETSISIPITRVARSLDPCEELALEKCQYFRAVGSGIANNETEARRLAMNEAQSHLAQMIRVVVDGGSQDYSKNMDGDQKSAQSIGEEVMNQFVFQSLESTKPIMWSKYDLSNGDIQIYVCMEITKDPNEFSTDFQDQIRTSHKSQINLNQTQDQTAMPKAATSSPEGDALCEEGLEDCRRSRYSVAIPKLTKAAEMGSSKAYYHLGLLYLYGDNVEKNTKTGFKYILIAAQGGDKNATFQVAELYNSGTGVTKDKEQARLWYEKAKELGDSRAESRLRRL